MEILVRPLGESVDEGAVEVVEHKGVGHPDTMCDAMAEAFAAGLARHYRDLFGRILHFNVDKALLAGGSARAAFGGGEVLRPLEVFLGGRATTEVKGARIAVDEIAHTTSSEWIAKNLRALDPERHVRFRCVVSGGSTDLVDLYDDASREVTMPVAGDTSIGVGFAPFSSLERAVLAAADRLRALSRERPEVGEDVKVMGVRRDERIHLTVACAFVGKHLPSLDAYREARQRVSYEVTRAVYAVRGREVEVEVNRADDDARGRVYLTVTGTSAEAGDDGEVGRGNRVTRLITPYRPMSLEATAGKNPVSHVGKLYNVTAQRIAERITRAVPEVQGAHCVLVSQIGRPVDQPMLADLRLRTSDRTLDPAVRLRAAEVAREEIASIGQLVEELLLGRVSLF